MAFETPNSDVNVDYSYTNSLQSQEILSKDSMVRESISTEWTDEKHSLYLRSMETSFVNNLYNSVDTLGWPSQREHSADIGKKNSSTGISSGQYKVLQGGHWEKVNFERQPLQINKANGPRVLLANPWIQHFRSAGRAQIVTSSELQERVSFGSLEVCGIGKMALTPGELAADLKQFPLCRDDSAGNITEGTDQNFGDEDSEEKKANVLCKAKRRKTSDVPSSIDEQVVPLGKCPLAYIVTKNCSSPERNQP